VVVTGRESGAEKKTDWRRTFESILRNIRGGGRKRTGGLKKGLMGISTIKDPAGTPQWGGTEKKERGQPK